MKRARNDFIAFLVTLGIFSLGSFLFVAIPDPFVKFHKPNSAFFYTFKNNMTRFSNAGLAREEHYDAIITGSSHSMNFKTSEMDALYGTNSIKLPIAGPTNRELYDLLTITYDSQDEINTVICTLEVDRMYTLVEPDYVGPGTPEYINGNSFFDFAGYIFDKQIYGQWVLPMWKQYLSGGAGYVPSRDQYAYTQNTLIMGPNHVLPDFVNPQESMKPSVPMSEEDRAMVQANVRTNLTSLIEEHPETKFQFVIAPCSIAWWGRSYASGDLDYVLAMEEVYVEELFGYDNVEIYDFNDCYDIIEDLNNYSDITHYGEWVNSYMLTEMYEGHHRLTANNYREHILSFAEYVREYDYSSLYTQQDLDDPVPQLSVPY